MARKTRSFTWVEEAVEGIRLAGELDAALDGSNLAGSAFNLGNTEEVSIGELAELCLQITGSDSEIIYEGSYTRRFQKKSRHLRIAWCPQLVS